MRPFLVLRFARALEPASVATVLRALADLVPDADSFARRWTPKLGGAVEICAVPWTGHRRALTPDEHEIGIAAIHFVDPAARLTTAPVIDDLAFPIDDVPSGDDVSDAGIAVKLAGSVVAGEEHVLAAFDSGRVVHDRARHAAYFWTEGPGTVDRLLWTAATLHDIVPLVHARFTELTARAHPFILAGNPLLEIYEMDGNAGVDAWIAEQAEWSDREVAAMLRELAVEIAAAAAGEDYEDDDDDEDEPGHDDHVHEGDHDHAHHDDPADKPADELDPDELVANDDERALDITGHAGDVLRERAAAGLLHPRAAEQLLPVLDVAERYEQRRIAVVEILGALRHEPAVPALIRILETTSIKSALDAVRKEELLAAAATALGAIGDPRAVPALARLGAAAGTHHDRARVAAAGALAACLERGSEPRVVDDTVLAALLQTICERNDGELNAQAHFAYGRLARLLPPDRRAEARRRLADADTARDDAVAMLARHAALLLAGPMHAVEPPPRELAMLLHESLTALDYDHEYTVRNIRVALQAAEIVPDLVDAGDLVWLTRFAESDIRRQAHVLLQRHDKRVEDAAQFDSRSVRTLEDAELVRWLGEAHVIGRAALIREASRRDLTGARPAVIHACHDVVSRARQSGESLLEPDTRILEASIPFLREVPLEDDVVALFDRMLRHPNVHVKWDLVEAVPRDERLIGAMFHVLRERWGWQAAAAREWLAELSGTPAYEAERLRASGGEIEEPN